MMIDRGLTIEMPKIKHFPYVIDWFETVGPSMPGFAGSVKISSTEFKSWLEITDTEATYWEIQTVLKMSEQYCYQLAISSDPKCKPPYEVEVTEEQMAEVRRIAAKKIQEIF